ncbi:hypothetical protein EX30DRAFT_162371 [Ascodesmis nigricans]|uniref:Uncharacterized protein n=1 Tax=Ascodesmis nigricans TaxID=341454 RepID=A0A4S2MS14_9PEZI|nr:hypothetical protein EX30DRAFT_162371 [Ascodesmis nigricans]
MLISKTYNDVLWIKKAKSKYSVKTIFNHLSTLPSHKPHTTSLFTTLTLLRLPRHRFQSPIPLNPLHKSRNTTISSHHRHHHHHPHQRFSKPPSDPPN